MIVEWPVVAVLDGVEVDGDAADGNRGAAPGMASFHFATRRGTCRRKAMRSTPQLLQAASSPLTILYDNLVKRLRSGNVVFEWIWSQRITPFEFAQICIAL